MTIKEEIGAEPISIVITDDGQSSSHILASRLVEQGHNIVLLRLPGINSIHAFESKVPTVKLGSCSETELNAAWEKITALQGRVDGLLHINPKGGKIHDIATLLDENELETLSMFFMLVKIYILSLTKDAVAPLPFVATVSRLDGKLGFGSVIGSPAIQSGYFGLIKSLRKEIGTARFKAMDIHPEIDDKDAARCIVRELRNSDADSAIVGIDLDRNRYVTQYTPSDEPDSEFGKGNLNSDDTLLITGGARGITSDCALELSKRLDCRFVLLGRSNIEENEPEWARHINEYGELQRAYLLYCKQNAVEVTPIEVKKTLAEILSGREVKKTMEIFSSRDIRAVYRHCDISDPIQLADAWKTLPDDFRNIKGLIHGAGVTADCRLTDKSVAKLNQVFNPKIRGIRTILTLIGIENLKFIMLFSSVSGYFGKEGQTDYAAANSILDSFAWAVSKMYDCRICSINWGPWSKGMVSEDLLKEYKSQKIETIPVTEGVDLFVTELLHGKSDDVQVMITSPTIKSMRNPD